MNNKLTFVVPILGLGAFIRFLLMSYTIWAIIALFIIIINILLTLKIINENKITMKHQIFLQMFFSIITFILFITTLFMNTIAR